jgi:hypothetical protein
MVFLRGILGFVLFLVLIVVPRAGLADDRGPQLFEVFAETCEGRKTASIDTASLREDQVWLPHSENNPRIQPGDAVRIASSAANRESLLPGTPSVNMIKLVPCTKGWVYVVTLSKLHRCSEASELQHLSAGIVVLMNGDSIVPLE